MYGLRVGSTTIPGRAKAAPARNTLCDPFWRFIGRLARGPPNLARIGRQPTPTREEACSVCKLG